jgi:hypothetical protein
MPGLFFSGSRNLPRSFATLAAIRRASSRVSSRPNLVLQCARSWASMSSRQIQTQLRELPQPGSGDAARRIAANLAKPPQSAVCWQRYAY